MCSNCCMRVPEDPKKAETTMNALQLISSKGYPAEYYEVQTEDGYVLTVHRIPHSRSETKGGNRPVVFIQHGLLCDSTVFLMDAPHQSLAFVMADNHFDVWLGNFRGNTYSKRHATMSPLGQDFWNFSWDQMAKYDLEAMINKALEVSNQQQLYYIGHSEGTMTAFAKFGQDRIFAKKIKMFFALAPVTTTKHIQGPLRDISKWTTQLLWLLQKIGFDDFLPNSCAMKLFAKYFHGCCQTNPLYEDFLFLVCGPDSHQMDPGQIPNYIAHVPSGTSTRNILHFGQMVKSGQFQMFNHGNAAANKKHYHQATPPVYNISDMQVPTVLFSSDTDWLADCLDVKLLIPQISNLVSNHNLLDFTHLDFLFGTRAPVEVYHPIVMMIKADAHDEHDSNHKHHINSNMHISPNHHVNINHCNTADERVVQYN